MSVQLLATVATANATATTADWAQRSATSGLVCMVDCSLVNAAVGDILDIVFETRADGVNYVEFARLPLILGTASDTTRVATGVVHPFSNFSAGSYDKTLGNGGTLAVFGDRIRATYTITDAGAASFSFRLVVLYY